ncbi:DUF4238 domain-containing protein [Burkholderia gladioli]|uniref:DUF4238 domain-containing protein n=1 Tax=Burkholderia gladioli TaxID=28095 RepID=UPI0034DB10A7
MMKFEKKNHHYVPQYWQRGFKGAGGHLYGKFGSDIKVVSPRTIMQSDWLYTVFDDQWNPSDALEDALSAIEAEDAKLFQRLHTPGYIATSSDRDQLCAALALQASRHPDVLARGQRLGKELGTLLADAHSMTLDDFKSRIAAFGVNEADAHDCYVALLMRTKKQLADELAELMALSPQSSELPAQDAIRAMPQITDAIKKLEFWLLDAPLNEAFVLGDTPLPQSGLGLGFSVPLSKSLAVFATPGSIVQTSVGRRFATAPEVSKINRIQSDNAREVVVGPSAALLSNL